MTIDRTELETETPPEPTPPPKFKQVDIQPQPEVINHAFGAFGGNHAPNVTNIPKKNPNPIDLVPKLVQLPNNWNLENIELKLDIKQNGFKDRSLISPDDHLDSDWEII